MFEQIERLERSVEMLLQQLEKERNANLQLREQVQELEQQVADRQQLETLNQQLKDQIGDLQGNVDGLSGEKTQLRERLEGILNKIDSMEKELSGQGS